ncbi:MAG: hypothetical protein IJQ73_06620 [Kiritimatiellae bacterium]|nr:hypothetical protein [Kiritimatiellia bacterium]
MNLGHSVFNHYSETGEAYTGYWQGDSIYLYPANSAPRLALSSAPAPPS